MRNKVLFFLSIMGLVGALVSAYLYSRQKAPQPPVFNPAANPYAKGIYANGIIESYSIPLQVVEFLKSQFYFIGVK